MSITTDPRTPTLTSTFRFWLPLAATWLMMATEGPTLTAVIARLPSPKLNLAAFGVAFAFALVVEAPVIMMMAASTALVRDRATYFKLRNFTHGLNALITAAMLLILTPPVHRFVTDSLLGLTPEVASRTWLALLFLLPWPGTIGLRRFYQGVLIRNGLTRLVAYGTVVRLFFMVGTTVTLALGTNLEGAAVGAGALSAGVTAEAIASYFLARPVIRRLLDGSLGEPLTDNVGLHYGSILTFYTPLALTSFLGLGIQPVVTFFVGHGRAPLESLAVLPVIHALVFVFRAFGLAFQEVAIALLGANLEGHATLRRFAFLLSVGVAGTLALIAWTPLAGLWFHRVSGLSLELTRFAILPLRILCLIPATTVLISYQRALVVHFKKTSHVTWATALEVLGVIAGLVVGIVVLDLPGAVAAAGALMIGRIAANVYLLPPTRRLLNSQQE